MHKIKTKIWDREFVLDVCKQCFPGEDPTTVQNEAEAYLESFIQALNASLKNVKEYVVHHGANITSVNNIFKYVMPKSIFIPRTKNRVTALLCNYKFDPEHGIAIVFENGKLKQIGMQDCVL